MLRPLRPLDCLTRGARAKLLEVQERYEGDKAAILTVLVSVLLAAVLVGTRLGP